MTHTDPTSIAATNEIAALDRAHLAATDPVARRILADEANTLRAALDGRTTYTMDNIRGTKTPRVSEDQLTASVAEARRVRKEYEGR